MANAFTDAPAETIYVLHGLSPTPPGPAVEKICTDSAGRFGFKVTCRQSNLEGELLGFIREAHASKAAGIVLAAGDRSHISTELHEALLATKIPTAEVHAGNNHAHETFRHRSFAANAAFATLAGFGIDGYRLAIHGLAARIGITAKA